MPGHQTILGAGARLALAFLLALPLGWERERRARWAGFRTYPLLSVCICGFLLLAQRFADGPTEEADVFYGVLTGVGFVGSGAIVRLRQHARGMSTAVSLWVTGAVGAGMAYGVVLLAASICLLGVAASAIPSHERGSA